MRLICDWCDSAQRPVVVADAGVYRAGAQPQLRALIEGANLPCVTMLMARHPAGTSGQPPGLKP